MTDVKTRRDPTRTGLLTGRRGGLWSALAVAAVLLLALATAWPADAQARRTRPPENSGSSGSTASSPPPSRPAPSPPKASSGGGSRSGGTTVGTARPRGGSVARTRPGSGTSPRVIDNDSRRYRYRDYRGYRPYRHGGFYPYPGFYSSWYYSPFGNPWYSRYNGHLGYWGYWGWYDWPRPYPYGAYPHTYYDAHYAYRVPYYASQVRDSMGALDLDLKPGNTQIYLDGQYIGTADDFDGWPQYLWLEKGDYHFVFYAEGRRTIAREYRILPSVVIDVEDRLERGEATAPEELFPVPTQRRDERLRRNAELRARAEAAERGDWRQRSERLRSRQPADADERDVDVESMDADFGSLVLRIEPADASVYLDGRFLGTAADLARLSRGLTVDPGEHELSIVRPGYAPEERLIHIDAGQSAEVAIALDPN